MTDLECAQIPTGAAWPKITLVTPSFNQGRFLEETIRSAILQNYPNLEYIIMDGGSSDNSVEIIRRYEPWISFWSSELDDGQSAAINAGFSRATGTVGGWINSDDVLLPGTLYRVARAFLNSQDATCVIGSSEYRSEDGNAVLYVADKIPRSRAELFRCFEGVFVPQPSCFFSIEAFCNVGGVLATFHFAMDLDLWFKLFKVAPPIILEDKLSWMRGHGSSKTFSHQDEMIREIEKVFDVNGAGWRESSPSVPKLIQLRKAENAIVFANGARSRGKRIAACKHVLAAVWHMPRIALTRPWVRALVNLVS